VEKASDEKERGNAVSDLVGGVFQRNPETTGQLSQRVKGREGGVAKKVEQRGREGTDRMERHFHFCAASMTGLKKDK